MFFLSFPFSFSYLIEALVNIRALNGDQLVFKANKHLEHIVEAANCLVMDKSVFEAEDSIEIVFPALNPIQIMHILNSLKSDKLSGTLPDFTAAKQLLTRMAARSATSLPLLLDNSQLISFDAI